MTKHEDTTQAAGGSPLERGVRQHSGDWMTVQEAERLAALWCAGQPLDDLPQWRTAMQVLARELADTRAALKKANDQAEHFERGWYLRGDALEHMRYCRECSETDVANCPTGEPLWDAAMPKPAAEVGAA